MKIQYEKFRENFILGGKIYKLKMRYKTLGENFILWEKISEMKLHVKLLEKMLQKKIDKLSIMDWETVEKIKRKLENSISFE